MNVVAHSCSYMCGMFHLSSFAHSARPGHKVDVSVEPGKAIIICILILARGILLFENNNVAFTVVMLPFVLTQSFFLYLVIKWAVDMLSRVQIRVICKS